MPTLNCLTREPYRFHRSLDIHPDPEGFEIHVHAHYEILIFLSGKVTYLVEGNQYAPKPYDIMLYNIGETHKAIVDPSVPYERYTIFFNKSYLSGIEDTEKLFSPFSTRPLGVNNLIHAESFPDNYWKLCLQRLENAGKDPLEIRANLLPLLNEIVHASANITSSFYQSNALAVQIVSYVNENITSAISAQNVAEHFHIGRSLLYTMFRKATGTSIHDYIRAKRLIRARQMLSDGAPPITACRQCGFNDYTTFFRSYKARFGTAPKDDMSKYVYVNQGHMGSPL